MRKIFLAVLVTASLLFTVPSYASEYSEVIGEVIDLIESTYVGDEVSQEELYEAALMGLSLVLDEYSGYMSEESFGDFSGEMSGRPVGIGISIQITPQGNPEIFRVLNGTPAEKAGLKRGDIITALNGVSSRGKTAYEISEEIENSEPEIFLEYTRDGEYEIVELVKEEIMSHTVYAAALEELTGAPAEGVGYINIVNFSETTAEDLRAAFDKYRGSGVTKLILDLRVNSGGRLDSVFEICGMLVPEGPAYHTVNRHGQRLTEFSELKELPFEEVAVLVDRYTASASELLAAAMQDAKCAVIIGETTFGKGVVQRIFMLPTGGAFKLTTEEYFRRSGEKVNGLGVTPDYAVETSMANYETPNDLMLQKAVELLSE